MQGTAILATRVAASLASLIAALVLLWGLTWTSPEILAVAVAIGSIAGALWWASTTPAARQRNRRMVIGGALASVCTVVVMALVISGVS
jgi:ABC-type bacteriocin/lantibiotic exporter with double-glycine peptidase domain